MAGAVATAVTASLAVWLIVSLHGPLAGRHADSLVVASAVLAATWWWASRTKAATAWEMVRTAAIEARANEERYRSLLQHSSDAVLVVDRTFCVTEATEPLERVLGRRPEDLEGSAFADLVDAGERPSVEALLSEMAEGRAATTTRRVRLRRGDGAWLQAEIVVADFLDDPNVGGLVVTIRDVSERRALEDKLRQLASHDPLTDLPNRGLFSDRVGHALALARRSRESCAVLFVDLDDFKRVNDSLGHTAGDQLLLAIAIRIQRTLRSGDSVARLGGDEFAVLAENLAGPADAVAVADRLLFALQAPVDIGSRSILPRASIGIAVTAAGVGTGEELLRNADVALYQAKSRGKGCHELFKPAMHAAALHRLELEEELRRAVAGQEFVVHYQPVVRLGDSSISGVEALVRWQHPERGLVYPGDFIPVAEETGLIVPIGNWMLMEACRHIAELQRRHGDERLRVAVNLSPRQFTDASLEGQINRALLESGIDPSTLVLEITETVLMADTQDTIERMVSLRRLGVSFAMDDFGTGYSSLSYLRRYPIQILKIDRSFIGALGDGREDAALVNAILTLADNLGMQVVAEGVEQGWQAELLQRLGCTLAQGYYFARPMDRDALAQTLSEVAAGRCLPRAAQTPAGPPASRADDPAPGAGPGVLFLRPLGGEPPGPAEVFPIGVVVGSRRGDINPA